MAQLPKVVRDAIASTDVQKQLRAVSDNHKLHIDQWAKLENEVLVTLLGFQAPSDLPKNIANEIGIDMQSALSLANDINTIVFEPIRQELERELEHPDAQAKELTTTEVARNQILAQESAPTIQPATPPMPKPTEKAVRTPVSSNYSARQASSERNSATGDPYRETPN